MKIRVVLLPDQESNAKLQDLSAGLIGPSRAEMRLDRTHLAHVTLFAAEVDDPLSLQARLDRVEWQNGPIALIADHFITEYPGWIELRFQDSHQVATIRDRTIEQFGQLLSQKAAEKYRSRTPHVTLGVLEGFVVKELEPIELRFDAIAIGESAEYGSLKQIFVSKRLG